MACINADGSHVTQLGLYSDPREIIIMKFKMQCMSKSRIEFFSYSSESILFFPSSKAKYFYFGSLPLTFTSSTIRYYLLAILCIELSALGSLQAIWQSKRASQTYADRPNPIKYLVTLLRPWSRFFTDSDLKFEQGDKVQAGKLATCYHRSSDQRWGF
jgi:hypothetical protein